MNVLDILINYHQGFLQGLFVTLQLAGIIWGGGLVLGTALGMAGAKHRWEIGLPTQVFSFFIRWRAVAGVPVLVALPGAGGFQCGD